MSSLRGVKPGDVIVVRTGYAMDRTLTVTRVGRVWAYANSSGSSTGWQERYRISDGVAPDSGSAMTVADYTAAKQREAVLARLRKLGLELRGPAGDSLSTELLSAIGDLIQEHDKPGTGEAAGKEPSRG